MRTVIQKTGENANCITACIASFFELDIDDESIIDVYSFDSGNGEWMKKLIDWFDNNGYEAVFDTLFFDDFVDSVRSRKGWQNWSKAGRIERIHFACGKTYRNPLVGHCVLYEKGKLLHDPHPNGNGLDKEEEYFIYLIRKIDG